jgi:hypothetical protein
LILLAIMFVKMLFVAGAPATTHRPQTHTQQTRNHAQPKPHTKLTVVSALHAWDKPLTSLE